MMGFLEVYRFLRNLPDNFPEPVLFWNSCSRSRFLSQTPCYLFHFTERHFYFIQPGIPTLYFDDYEN